WSFYGEATYQNDHYMDPLTGRRLGSSFTVMEDRNFDSTPETYDIRLAGRTEDRSTSWSLGAAFQPGPRIAVTADYTFDGWASGLESRSRNGASGIGTDDPLDNWGSDVRDDYRTASLGVEAKLTPDARWRLALDASRSVGAGNIDTHFAPGG